MVMTASYYAKDSCRAKNNYCTKLKRVRPFTSKALLLPIALSLCLLSNQASARTPSPLCDTLATYDENKSMANHNEESLWKDVDAQTIISACKQAISFYPDDIRYVYQLAEAYDNDEDYAQAFIYYSQAAK
jgi:TPR repeat protein